MLRKEDGRATFNLTPNSLSNTFVEDVNIVYGEYVPRKESGNLPSWASGQISNLGIEPIKWES